jgi:hypothetical protein
MRMTWRRLDTAIATAIIGYRFAKAVGAISRELNLVSAREVMS